MASSSNGVKPPNSTTLTGRIDALLPQTQCRQCGYAGCLPYAEAISSGAADINRCPPGGNAVIEDLAALLQRPPIALDATCGVTKPPAVALIDEAWCIGCTLCIQACPVDAIAGAAKLMHTVIAQECTGCELCIPPCPVDCITMTPVTLAEEHGTREHRLARAAHARRRYVARENRLATERARRALPPGKKTLTADQRKKQAAVERALASARARIQRIEK
jgi:Na+-translocating ferredoxin:NAD+ oxidoreductase subunit B